MPVPMATEKLRPPLLFLHSGAAIYPVGGWGVEEEGREGDRSNLTAGGRRVFVQRLDGGRAVVMCLNTDIEAGGYGSFRGPQCSAADSAIGRHSSPQRGHRGGSGKLASPAASILVHPEPNHSYDSKPAIPRGGSTLNCSISGCQFDWSNEMKLPIKRGGRGKIKWRWS